MEKKGAGGVASESEPRQVARTFAAQRRMAQGEFISPEHVKSNGVPGRRQPAGVACAAFAETVKAVAARPREV